MGFIAPLDSSMRWLVLVFGGACAVQTALTSLRHTSSKPASRAPLVTFAGLIDIQAVVGLAVHLGNKSEIITTLHKLSKIIPHTVTMFLTLLATHARSHWPKSDTNLRRVLPATLISLTCICAGI